VHPGASAAATGRGSPMRCGVRVCCETRK
jgi:hypothetical protein